jgi:antitoxin (DNA-binding transcriptional repressor) of toxin-antitoxin stability system
MKTLSATKARQNLGEWIDRAIRGEDIGIVHSASGKIVALRPVEVYSEDYAWIEYGLTKEEVDRAGKKVMTEIKKERKEGKLKPWKP